MTLITTVHHVKTITTFQGIEIIFSAHALQTYGWRQRVGFELRVQVRRHPLAYYQELITHLISISSIFDDFTGDFYVVSYGTWALAFSRTPSNIITLHELVPGSGDATRPNVDFTVGLYQRQRVICARHHARPTPPGYIETIGIVPGFFTAPKSSMIRYPRTLAGTSGWICLPEGGDDNDVEFVPLRHLHKIDSHLCQYLALSVGFVVSIEEGSERVHYDPRIGL